MAEKIYNGVVGQGVSPAFPFYNPITFANGSTTTGTWASATSIPTIASGDFIKIVLEPGTVNEEIVYLNGPYTAAATSSSNFTRAAEDSTGGVSAGAGVAHSAVDWVHTVTALDFTKAAGRFYVGSQTISNNTITPLLGSVDFVQGGITYSTPSSVSTLTVAVAGRYWASWQCGFTAGNTGNPISSDVYVNGSQARISGFGSAPIAGFSNSTSPGGSDLLTLNAGDAVTLSAYQLTGSALNLSSGASLRTWLTLAYYSGL